MYARTAVAQNISAKLIWFVSEPLRDALNLLFIRPSTFVAGGVALFAGVGFWLYWPGPTKARFVRGLFAVALVPATYRPIDRICFSRKSWASYRTQVALTNLLLVYATLELVGWLRAFNKAAWLPAIMAAVVATCAVAAGRNVTLYFVLPQGI